MTGLHGARPTGARTIALLFPGQGAQHVRMAAGLYRHDPGFTATADEILDLLGPEGAALREDWLSVHPRVPIDHVTRAQPLLFLVDLALGRMVMRDWGVRPAALLGHSMGELVAATLAGVFTLPCAVRLVRDRVRRALDAPAGGMVAVAASTDDIAAHLGPDVAVAAVNAPRQTVLSGLDGPLAAVSSALRSRGYTVARVPSLTPFHSPALAPVNTGAAEALAGFTLRAPAVDVYSGYTGTVLTHGEATDPGFWARQLVDPVLFWPALDALLAAGDHLLLEAGPGRGLTMLARRHPAVATGASRAVPLLPAGSGPPERDLDSLGQALDAVRAAGHRAAVRAST